MCPRGRLKRASALIATFGTACWLVGAAVAPNPQAAAAASARAASGFVTVPDVQYGYIAGVYDDLHAMGLRVTIRNAFKVSSLCGSLAVRQDPAAGTQVAPNSIVKISVDGCMPGRPTGYQHAAVTPAFSGKRVTTALTWATKHGLFWEAHLSVLSAGNASEFFMNYRIWKQSPRAGSKTFLFTPWDSPAPLVVWGRAWVN